MRAGCKFEAWVNLLGSGDAAEQGPSLQKQNSLAALREIRCGHQSVVAAADNDCLVVLHRCRIAALSGGSRVQSSKFKVQRDRGARSGMRPSVAAPR
jgi:hypothetical protein